MELAVILKIIIDRDSNSYSGLNRAEIIERLLIYSHFRCNIFDQPSHIIDVTDVKLLEILKKNKTILEQYMENDVLPAPVLDNTPLPGYTFEDSHFIFQCTDWLEKVNYHNIKMGYWNWVKNNILNLFGFIPNQQVIFSIPISFICETCGLGSRLNQFYVKDSRGLCPQCGERLADINPTSNIIETIGE